MLRLVIDTSYVRQGMTKDYPTCRTLRSNYHAKNCAKPSYLLTYRNVSILHVLKQTLKEKLF